MQPMTQTIQEHRVEAEVEAQGDDRVRQARLAGNHPPAVDFNVIQPGTHIAHTFSARPDSASNRRDLAAIDLPM